VTGDQDRDDISDEARLMAARVRERAERLPTAAELAALTMTAGGRDMSAAEIRQLGTDAIAQAQQVSYLLGKLAGLLDEPAGDT
jgi:hypothetical protein